MNLEIRQYTADEAASLIDALVACYLDVYADDNPAFHSEDRYRQQLAGHMARAGWQLVTAIDDDGGLVGYIYGFTLPAESRWWEGLIGDLPGGTVESGRRTLAISELMVREPWRRRGIAGQLHAALVDGRSEERATLLVRPDNRPAQVAYRRWGWETVAQLQPSWDHAPLYDVMIRPVAGVGAG